MTHRIRLRQIQEDDLQSIKRLCLELGYKTDSPGLRERIKRILADQGHLAVVAVIDDEIAGFIHAFETQSIISAACVEIGALIVSARHQRNGIGRRLVRQVEKWSRSPELRVRCNTKRTFAHQFYESLKFSLQKEQKVYWKKLKPADR